MYLQAFRLCIALYLVSALVIAFGISEFWTPLDLFAAQQQAKYVAARVLLLVRVSLGELCSYPFVCF